MTNTPKYFSAPLLWLALLLCTALAALSAQPDIELEGPITAVNGTTIELFGGQVRFDAAGAQIETDDENFKNISDLPVGADIEVDADVSADGSIHVTRIEVSDEKDPDTGLTGVIVGVDEAAGTFTIGPVTVHYDGATKIKKLSGIRAGVLVEVIVEISGDHLRARLVEPEEAD